MTSSPNLPTQSIAVKPVVLAAPARGDDLQVRISAPTSRDDLPVIVLAHGFGLSMNSYDPLVDHWTAHGFVVVQPTFLDFATLALTPDDPRYPDIRRARVGDLTRVVDDLEVVLAAVPGLAERVDRNRLAVAGHSWGGQSVGMLLGARVDGMDGAEGEPGPDARDTRVKAGVLLSATGTGGDNLTPFAQQNFAFMSPDFTGLAAPILVVAGDADQSPLSTRGPDWFTDVYTPQPRRHSSAHSFRRTTHPGRHSRLHLHRHYRREPSACGTGRRCQHRVPPAGSGHRHRVLGPYDRRARSLCGAGRAHRHQAGRPVTGQRQVPSPVEVGAAMAGRLLDAIVKDPMTRVTG